MAFDLSHATFTAAQLGGGAQSLSRSGPGFTRRTLKIESTLTAGPATVTINIIVQDAVTSDFALSFTLPTGGSQRVTICRGFSAVTSGAGLTVTAGNLAMLDADCSLFIVQVAAGAFAGGSITVELMQQ